MIRIAVVKFKALHNAYREYRRKKRCQPLMEQIRQRYNTVFEYYLWNLPNNTIVAGITGINLLLKKAIQYCEQDDIPRMKLVLKDFDQMVALIDQKKKKTKK